MVLMNLVIFWPSETSTIMTWAVIGIKSRSSFLTITKPMMICITNQFFVLWKLIVIVQDIWKEFVDGKSDCAFVWIIKVSHMNPAPQKYSPKSPYALFIKKTSYYKFLHWVEVFFFSLKSYLMQQRFTKFILFSNNIPNKQFGKTHEYWAVFQKVR